MWLQAHFSAAGPMRFDRFMELALYDPEHGYYAGNVSLGARGDFSTSATMSDLLATAIAAWIVNGNPAHVIEIGAGTGELARAITRPSGARSLIRRLTGRRWPAAPFTYHIVERSPRLRDQQRRLLGPRAQWHDTVPEALAAAQGEAFLFSNELVDAFPARVFQAQAKGDSWRELYLLPAAGQLAEHWVEIARQDLPASTIFECVWPEGQRVEVHDQFQTWLASWAEHWVAGQLLTIDYGGSPAEIYRRKPAGTFRSYYNHQSAAAPEAYTLAGRRDLTADVNFDDLIAWGESLGLATRSLETQREFLLPHRDPAHSSDPDRFLLNEQGAGTAFKVLTQIRG